MSLPHEGPDASDGRDDSDEQDPFSSTINIPIVDGDTEEMSTDDVSAVEGLPGGSALLLVQRGPSAGARFLLDTDEVLVGRHPSSDIFLDDITVSRRHAAFRRTGQGFSVTDLGSLNGTYVNRDRIENSIALTGGDEVQIGKFRLIYFAGSSTGTSSGQ